MCSLSFHPAVLGAPLLTSTHPRAGVIPTPSGNHLLLMTRVSKAACLGQLWAWARGRLPVPPLSPCCSPPTGKAAAAAADPNAAWAAYYSHYYQQPPGPVPGPAPAPAAPPSQGEPPQPPPAGQSDYTKAWEEYYKKIGECERRLGGRAGSCTLSCPLTSQCPPPAGQQPQQPGAPPQQDYTKAWEEYYKKQGERHTKISRGM